MTLSFVAPHAKILRQVSHEVSPAEIETQSFQLLLERMFSFAKNEQADPNRSVLVGLAAPQVGIAKRIILVDVEADGKGGVGKLKAYINPQILWKSDEEEKWYEGCYSTGRVTGIVSRAKRIQICALDKRGKRVEEEHVGYIARSFQHEIDHLEGIVFPMRVKGDRDLHIVFPEEFPLYRNTEAWRSWDRICSRKTWEKVQTGAEDAILDE